MLVRLVLGFCVLMSLFACSNDSKRSFDTFYHRIQQCQSQDGPSCRNDLSLWHQVTPLIESLQNNPQILGVELMKLQTSMVFSSNKASFDEKKQKEGIYYQVIRWFESPRG
jgi:hypothetical protein